MNNKGAKRALTHSSIYAIGNITRQLAGFIMLPIYTRHLSPTDYGVVGLLLAALALIEVFFGARLAQAVPKFYFDETTSERQNAIISTALIITSLSSLITMVALIGIRNETSQLLFNSPNYGASIGAFSVLILTQAVEFYAMTFIRIQQRPWLFISISLMKLILQLSMNIWLVVYKDMGVTGVAIGSAGSSAVFALGLSIYTLSRTGMVFCKEKAVAMLKFSWPLWIGGLAGLYIGSASRYFINVFSSTADVGLFELATKFSGILTLLLWDPFQQYWNTEKFKIYKNDNAREVFRSTYLLISSLLAIGTLGIGLFADPIIRIMAAPNFYQAALAVPLLTIGASFTCISNFANFSLLVQERTLWLSRNNYATAIVLTVLFIPLVPIWGFVGAAAASATAFAIQFVIIQQAGKKVYDMNIELKPMFLHMGIAGLILFTAGLFRTSNLALQILISTITFVAGSAVITTLTLRDHKLRDQIFSLLPPAFRRYSKVFTPASYQQENTRPPH